MKLTMKERVTNLIIKWGANEQEAKAIVDDNFEMAVKCCRDASASYYADFIRTVAHNK